MSFLVVGILCFDFRENFHFESKYFYLAWPMMPSLPHLLLYILPILFGKFNLLEDEKLYLVYLCAIFVISFVRFVLKSKAHKKKTKLWIKYGQVHFISLIDKHNKRKTFCWCFFLSFFSFIRSFFALVFYFARVFSVRVCSVLGTKNLQPYVSTVSVVIMLPHGL